MNRRRTERARLRFHQLEALTFLRSGRRLFNTSEYGTGKTPPAVARLADLVPPHRALVVSTGGMIGTRERPGAWERNCRMFGRREWIYEYLVGRRSDRWRSFARPHHIAFANYEAVLVLGSALLSEYPVIVFDEVHRLKNPASKMSRAWAAIAERAEYVYGLTGSPLLESPLDLYGVVRAVHPEMYGPSFYGWRNRFFVRKSEVGSDGVRTFPRWTPRDHAMEDLAASIASISFRRTQAQLPFDWPREVNAEPLVVDLAPAAERVYRRLERQMEIQLASGALNANNIRPRLQKLCQLTAGWVYDSAHRPIQIAPSTKALAFADLFDQIHREGPVVVWCVTPPDMALVRNALARFGPAARSVVVRGRTPAGARQELIERFNAGHANVLIAHPTCLGEGVDLEAAHDVRFSRTWSALQYSQSRGRTRRMTSRARVVTYTEIVARNTVDEGIMEALARKVGFLKTLLALGSVDAAVRRIGSAPLHSDPFQTGLRVGSAPGSGPRSAPAPGLGLGPGSAPGGPPAAPGSAVTGSGEVRSDE